MNFGIEIEDTELYDGKKNAVFDAQQTKVLN